MEQEIIDTSIIDPNLASYEQFFDHGWCDRVFGLVENSPLRAAVETLMLAWRSTDGAHRLPWLAVQQLKQFAVGTNKPSASYPPTFVEALVQTLSDKLINCVPELNFKQRLALGRAIGRLKKETLQARKAADSQITIDVEGYWNSLIEKSEFDFCILGVQRINYGSLFFAYEDFLANTIRTKDPDYRSKNNPIKGAFARHFGVSLTDYCWNDAEVDLAKLVRHALAHNGGSLGTDLDRYKTRFVDATGMTSVLLQGDRFNVVNGKIQITPCNTKYLFGVLKDRVSRIVEEVA